MENREWLSIDDMMGQSSVGSNKENSNVVEVNIAQLHMFEGHPFRLYEGERLEQMVQSIKDFGVLIPILVRRLKRGKFGILAGHNRVNAARLAGLETVPAIIKEHLDDEEAMLIVAETNLMQRSFSDMSYSERAFALKTHHQVLSAQGKRTDLLKQIKKVVIEEMDITSGQVGEKLRGRDKIGEAFHLSARTVARYLRICELIKPLQQRLDTGEIAFTVAETISYMTQGSQEVLETFLMNKPRRISYKEAELLKEYGNNNDLDLDDIEELLLNNDRNHKKLQSIKIGSKVISRFFEATASKQDIEIVVERALEQYFKMN